MNLEERAEILFHASLGDFDEVQLIAAHLHRSYSVGGEGSGKQR